MTRSTRVEGILLFCLKENSESLNPQLVPKRLLALAAVSGKNSSWFFLQSPQIDLFHVSDGMGYLNSETHFRFIRCFFQQASG